MKLLKHFIKKICVLVLMLFLFNTVFAQRSDTTDIYNMSLEELMNMEVAGLSKKATPLRENPSVISVITAEDIKNSGARDLIDVLMLLVPGFEFGVDVEGVVGIGTRGMWAHDGKVLLLLDGMECNEDVFSNTAFGNNYLVENIDKIEIVRGPGSASYGGYASLGVINITTKGYHMKGGYAGVLYSQMSKTYSHRNLNFGYGNKINDFGFSITGIYSQGNRSERDNIDYYGNSMTMKGNSDITNSNFNLSLNYKGLDFKGIADFYNLKQIDLWGANRIQGALTEKFNSLYAYLAYDFKIDSSFKIIPRIQYKHQTPWNVDVPEQSYACTKVIDKIFANTTMVWDISSKINFTAGFEYVNTKLAIPSGYKSYEELFKNNTNKTYTNISAFGQFMYFNPVINLTIGGRYDKSSEFGSSFVPRVGITKAVDNFHFKTMVSKAFRVPGGILPERVPDGAKSISPEKATNFEIEVGLKISSNSYLTINGYDIQFNDVIVYERDALASTGTFVNKAVTGSRGIEAEYRLKTKNVMFLISYAYYEAVKLEVANFQVPDHSDYTLGFAPNKINSLISFKINEKITFNSSLSYIGKRYAFTYKDNITDEDILTEVNSNYIWGVNCQFSNLFVEKLNFMIGVSNILNQTYNYLQPYKGGHAPLPGLSRAFQIRATYNF